MADFMFYYCEACGSMNRLSAFCLICKGRKMARVDLYFDELDHVEIVRLGDPENGAGLIESKGETKMLIYLSLLVAIVGVLVYIVSANPKYQEIGRVAWMAGLLAFLLQVVGSKVIGLGR